MKVLWHSNAPWTATGYGQQSRIFLPRIAQEYETAVSVNYGHAGSMSAWKGLPVYPGGFDAYGNDSLLEWAKHWMHPDQGWIFALYDAWVFRSPGFRDWHMAVWAPVDHQPLPPDVTSSVTELGLTPVAMSRFGQGQFQAADLDAFYLPHAVDPEFTPKDRSTARARFGLPEDAFVVGMNANNKAAGSLHRKGFGEAIHAFKLFVRKHPDAILWVHSEALGLAGGWDLERIVSGYGLAGKVWFTNQLDYRVGLPVDQLADLYSTFDVLLSPSYGEGFGVPIMEAQACGVPVIVTDHTAMPELVGDGWTVPGQLLWHEQHQAFWKVPNIGGLVDALTEAYERGQGSSESAVKFAQGYQPDRVWNDHFKPVLGQLEERLG